MNPLKRHLPTGLLTLTALAALALYILAKLFEVFDHQLFDLLRFVSGHTLKHLFAACGAYAIVAGIGTAKAPSKTANTISA